jgi:hypothetical protein
MEMTNNRLSRISKLFLDRDSTPVDLALAQRKSFQVALQCGSDAAHSRTLQLAILTAASLATRCFPGAVTAILEPAVADAPNLVWPSLSESFGQTLALLLGSERLANPLSFTIGTARIVTFGNEPAASHALRATFDGWTARVAPAAVAPALPQREYCSLAGVLAGAICVAELFLSFAELNIASARRSVEFSLWRPDLAIADPLALGPPVEYLPKALWTLGLGHLGNSYLWSLASLPYSIGKLGTIYLNDFDKVEMDNWETGIIYSLDDVDHMKTRVCSRWLEARGFETRCIERPFDSNFRRRADEPALAFSGFDSNEVRRDLISAQFGRVMDSGLGGTKDNFDTIGFHAWPNSRSVKELWPVQTADERENERKFHERVARENPGYSVIGGDACGRALLAGKSVAVPFVGAVASTLAVAETLRVLHGGPAFEDIRLSLSDLSRRFAHTDRSYSPSDLAGIDAVSL